MDHGFICAIGRTNHAPPQALDAAGVRTNALWRPRGSHDIYFGGTGSVQGTVKEKNTPANTPLRRRVVLIDQGTRLTIRETWSAAATGAYEFPQVSLDASYTVLSYDHTGTYRAVIADNIRAAAP